MSLKRLLCLLIAVVGVVIFIDGANYYEVAIGWTGIDFFVGGILTYVLLKAYESTTRRLVSAQKT